MHNIHTLSFGEAQLIRVISILSYHAQTLLSIDAKIRHDLCGSFLSDSKVRSYISLGFARTQYPDLVCQTDPAEGVQDRVAKA
jgi:hypothetical protein